MAEATKTYTDDDIFNFTLVAVGLVKEAGEMIRKAISDPKSVTMKEPDEKESREGNSSSVLTETDQAVEKHIVYGLSQAFPEHAFIGEEETGTAGMVKVWKIDNFVCVGSVIQLGLPPRLVKIMNWKWYEVRK